MNLQEMIDAINRRVDDVVDPTDAIEWLNAGKNRMAMAVKANFPDLTASDMQGSFAFPAKYHEGPVLYAAAKFKELDSSLAEAANFMSQFELILREFMENYEIPPRYRDDHLSQQFIATAGQTVFTITKNSYNPRYGDLKVYVNDRLVERKLGDGTDFVLLTPASAGDAVTAVWEEHFDLVEPPYNWWIW